MLLSFSLSSCFECFLVFGHDMLSEPALHRPPLTFEDVLTFLKLHDHLSLKCLGLVKKIVNFMVITSFRPNCYKRCQKTAVRR